jgi:hypothetical protein
VGTLEYRAPLALLHRGLWWLPAFLDRGSLALYADAGTAGFGGRVFPIRGDRTIASLGAELALNVALQYDVPYLVRVGVGVPVHGREQTSADAAAAYVRVGASF